MPEDTAKPNTPTVVDPKFLASQAKALASLGEKLVNNTQLANVAGRTRATWVQYGVILAGVRDAIKGNVAFNKWLKDNDLEKFADRNARTDAMWMASQDDSLLSSDADLCPPTLHAPKAVRAWYRTNLDRIVAATKGEVAGKDFDALTEWDRRFHAAVLEAEWNAAVTRFKNKVAPVSFKDMGLPEAVGVLIEKIRAHSTPAALATALAEALPGTNWEPAPTPAAVEPTTAAEPEEGDAPADDEPTDGDEAADADAEGDATPDAL